MSTKLLKYSPSIFALVLFVQIISTILAVPVTEDKDGKNGSTASFPIDVKKVNSGSPISLLRVRRRNDHNGGSTNGNTPNRQGSNGQVQREIAPPRSPPNRPLPTPPTNRQGSNGRVRQEIPPAGPAPNRPLPSPPRTPTTPQEPARPDSPLTDPHQAQG